MRNPRYSEWKETLRKLLSSFILVSGVVVAVIALLSKQDSADIAKWPWVLPAIVNWLVENNWWIVLTITVLLPIAKLAERKLEQSWIWSAVQSIVDRIQTDAFANQNGYAHHHRATLFQYQRYKWWPFPARGFWPWGKGRAPCSGWLVPAIRSGHTTQRTSTYFLAPDDADSAEGMAGHVWASNNEAALNAGSTLQRDATEEAVSDYAAKTFVSADWARREVAKNKVLAASFRGIPIEGKAGRRWGVLVLDSRNPEGAVNAAVNMRPYAYCLGKLLERV